MPPHPDDNLGALERARKRLYTPGGAVPQRSASPASHERSLPHAWEGEPFVLSHRGKRHLRLASVFLMIAILFFVAALGVAGYFFYFGGNSVSTDKVTIELQGPTTVAGGDTVPLSLVITNRNPVAIEDAHIEIDFPDGTLTADGSLRAYPRYTEDLGTLKSGEIITRSLKAIIFGGAGQTLTIPVSLSYGTSGSSAVFVKKDSYALAVSSTPLSISVDALSETVSGKPLTFTLTVRSNASVPLENVALSAATPFGFSVTSSSLPMQGSILALGTLSPGATKTVTLTGTLAGQDGEQRTFRFTVGTLRAATDSTLAVSYMIQDASVVIAAPFIATTLSLNGDTSSQAVIAPGSSQNVTVSYTNTLPTSVSNAVIAIALSGSAVDYSSVRTTGGFYRSSDRTIIFSRDTDPALIQLSPGASGIGTFTFSTLPTHALGAAPSVTFTTSVSGIRFGQSMVPESVSATAVKTVKVATAVTLSARSAYFSGPFANAGPLPPRVNQATTYTVSWSVANKGSSIADGTVVATLPSYVSYTEKTSGTGSFSYNESSHTLSWKVGDLAQGMTAEGVFQISLTPSLSQLGTAPELTGPLSFSGFDRFAGVEVRASAGPVTTDTRGDVSYSLENATVQ